MIEPCNHDWQQGKACYCTKPSRLSFRGMVILAYAAFLAVAIGTAVSVAYFLSPVAT